MYIQVRFSNYLQKKLNLVSNFQKGLKKADLDYKAKSLLIGNSSIVVIINTRGRQPFLTCGAIFLEKLRADRKKILQKLRLFKNNHSN